MEVPSDIAAVVKKLDQIDKGPDAKVRSEIVALVPEIKKLKEEAERAKDEAKLNLLKKVAVELRDLNEDFKINSPHAELRNSKVSMETKGSKNNTERQENRNESTESIGGDRPMNWKYQGGYDVRETLDEVLGSSRIKFQYELKAVPDEVEEVTSEERKSKVHSTKISSADGVHVATLLIPQYPNEQEVPHLLKIVPTRGEEIVYSDKAGRHSSENFRKTLEDDLQEILTRE